MKKIKRLLSILFASLLLFAVGCNNVGNNPEKETLTFVAPDGAPALAIAKFINDKESLGINADFNYSVVASSDIGGIMQQGKADFMIMPVNAASKLYKANASDPYKMLAVITHGNLYLMASDGTNSLEGLKGKVVGVIGQGLVPDLTFKAVLSDNGLLADVVVGDTATDGKITLRYFSQAVDMIPLLKQGKLNVGLLPEPACTNLTKVASEKQWTRMDVQELYNKNTKAYPQAVLMVKSSVYEKYELNLAYIESTFGVNVDWIKANPALAVEAINGVLKEGVTASLVANNITSAVIDNCKIYYENSANAKQSVIEYINKIIAVNEMAAKPVMDDFFA